MTYQELQIQLLKMNLTIKDLAKLIGMNPNSITNYKSKDLIPLNLAIILSLIINIKNNGVDPETIINEVKRKHSIDLSKSHKN